MAKRFFALLTAALLTASVMPAATAFDIIYTLPPISATLSVGNKTVTFEPAPSPGEYIAVYPEWDAFKIAEEGDGPGSGAYSKQDVTTTLIPPGANIPASNTIPENLPEEELHTDFTQLPIYDVVNGEYLLGSTQADLSILVIGNSLCSYTIKRVQFLKDLLESLNAAHVKLYLLDMGKEVGNERTDAECFAERNPSVLVARAADSSDVYYRLFFEVCRTRGKAGGRLPAICVLDSRCKPIYTTVEILFDENELSEILRPYTAAPYDNVLRKKTLLSYPEIQRKTHKRKLSLSCIVPPGNRP